VWNRYSEFFIFQILNDDENDKNLSQFLKTLAALVCSAEYDAHPLALSEDEANEYLYTTKVPSIDEFLEENYSKYYASEAYLNSAKAKNSTEKNKNFNNSNNTNNSIINLNGNNNTSKSNNKNTSKSTSITNTINTNSKIDNSVDNEEEEQIDINKIEELTYKFSKKVEIKTFNFKKANPSASNIFNAMGVVLRYDQKSDNLEVLSESAEFLIYKLDQFEYYLVVDEEGNKQTYTSTKIAQETNLIQNKKENCILWLAKDSNVTNAYNFIFDDSEKLKNLGTLLTKSQYEASNRNNYEDLKEEDRQWLENANNCDLDANSSALDFEMDLETDYLEENTGGTNVASAQAYMRDRTFIIRDDNVIAVYKSVDDHSLKVYFALNLKIAKFIICKNSYKKLILFSRKISF
jgi:IS1 family transposase